MSTAIGVGVGILVVVPGCFMDIPWPKQTRGEERDRRDWGEEAWVVRMKEGEKD
jgi:hypothetical protein